MQGQTMFLVCPAYLDTDGVRRCGLPAEVEVRYTMRSTDGPLESAKIRCPRGHGFNGPIEFLTIREQPAAAAASVTSASTNNVFAEAALDCPAKQHRTDQTDETRTPPQAGRQGAEDD